MLVYEGDNALVVAQEFAAKHGLEKELYIVPKLQEAIVNHHNMQVAASEETVLVSLDVDVGERGQLPMVVHEGDDALVVAQEFAAKHELAEDVVTKLQEAIVNHHSVMKQEQATAAAQVEKDRLAAEAVAVKKADEAVLGEDERRLTAQLAAAKAAAEEGAAKAKLKAKLKAKRADGTTAREDHNAAAAGAVEVGLLAKAAAMLVGIGLATCIACAAIHAGSSPKSPKQARPLLVSEHGPDWSPNKPHVHKVAVDRSAGRRRSGSPSPARSRALSRSPSPTPPKRKARGIGLGKIPVFMRQSRRNAHRRNYEASTTERELR